MTKRKEKREFTVEQASLAQKIFDTVYKWGKVNIKTTHEAPFYEELIWKLIDESK